MYAIIQDGGHQHKVEPGDTCLVQLRAVEPGTTIVFDKVAAIGGEDRRDVGTPFLGSVSVSATVVRQVKGPKLVAFTYRRRKDSRRKIGHRQKYTEVRIDTINA